MTMVPPWPADEMARLLDLTRYQILDTPGEEAFDRLTRLATRLLGVQVAAVNFVDSDRHWSKSITACTPASLPREASFCAWTILSDAPTVIPDLRLDARFSQHPAVTGEPHLRLYAGVPLTTPAGHRIGTLCVLGDQPRVLSAEELRLLQDLAAIACNELELRRHLQQVSGQLDLQVERAQELQRYLEHVQTLDAINTLMDLPLEPQEVAVQSAALIAQAIGTDWAGLITFRGGVPFTTCAYSRPGLSPLLSGMAEHLNTLHGGVSAGLARLSEPKYLDRYAEHPAALPLAVQAGAQSAAWIPLGHWDGNPFLLLTFRAGEPRRRPWPDTDRHLLETAARAVRAALNRRAALEAADRAAKLDPLTGIHNRRAFEQDLALMGAGGPFTLALIDLDGFKRLNDTVGHQQGDRALQRFAGALAAAVQPAEVFPVAPLDTVPLDTAPLDVAPPSVAPSSALPPGPVESSGAQAYRLGGDEFALLLPGLISGPVPDLLPGLISGHWSEERVREVVDAAARAARRGVTAPGVEVGASMGLAHSAERLGDDPQELIQRLIGLADARMYAAKRSRQQRQAVG